MAVASTVEVLVLFPIENGDEFVAGLMVEGGVENLDGLKAPSEGFGA